MKRFVCLLLAMLLLCAICVGCGTQNENEPTATPSVTQPAAQSQEDEDTEIPKTDISANKRITKIVYHNEYTDASGYGYEYIYNDKKQLVKIEQGDASSETKRETIFTYSPDGKLLWATIGEPIGAYAPDENCGCGYEYNSSGQLVKEFSWEGGYGEITYEYDSAGRCVRSVEITDFQKQTEKHIYGEDGVRLYSEVNVVYEDDDEQENYVIEYDYSYKPFVLKQKRNTNWRYLELPIDENISAFSFFFMDDVEFSTDAEGYLEKVETESETYYFHYDGFVDSMPEEDAGDKTAERLRKSIVGAWGTVGALTNEYVFNADGSCYSWFDQQAEGTYKIEDDKTLVVTFPWAKNIYIWTDETFDEWHSHSTDKFWYMNESGELLLNGVIYYRNVDGKTDIDYNTEGDLLSKIAGTWVLSNYQEYRFFKGGTFENNMVTASGRKLLNRVKLDKGSIEIIDDTHAKLWNTAEGGGISGSTELVYDPKTDTLCIGGSRNVYHRAEYSD